MMGSWRKEEIHNEVLGAISGLWYQCSGVCRDLMSLLIQTIIGLRQGSRPLL